jgi:hypothetical protein
MENLRNRSGVTGVIQEREERIEETIEDIGTIVKKYIKCPKPFNQKTSKKFRTQ